MLTTHVGILVLGVFLGYKKGNLFNKYLIMMVVSLILCAISSKVYRNQSFISSLYASLFILDIFFYYFLVYLNVGVKRFEKVLVILIVATCLGFILLFLNADENYKNPSMPDYFPAMQENRKNREISPMQDLKVSDRMSAWTYHLLQVF